MNIVSVKKAVVAAVASVALLASADVSAPQWECEMTIAGYAGSTTLANFPLLVKISPARISGFSYDDCAAGGADISFTDTNGLKLSHEVDTWNPDGESLV